jgi:hypothetical protein
MLFLGHFAPNLLTTSSHLSDVVHRLISRRHTAVGDFADFQGASDEHT